MRSVGYGSKHASQRALSGKTLVRTYTHNTKTTDCIWTFYILKDCSTIEFACFLFYSCMRDTISELSLLTQHCVLILQARKYIAIWCATTHDSKTHVPYVCILHTKRRLYCQQCIIFLEQSWLLTLYVVVSFQFIVVTASIPRSGR